MCSRIGTISAKNISNFETATAGHAGHIAGHVEETILCKKSRKKCGKQNLPYASEKKLPVLTAK